MKDSTKKFYETMYKSGRIPPSPKGVLGYLFSKLRRFEVHRRDAIFSLLDPGFRFLDLGYGDGSLMILAKKEKFKKVYGLDISENILNTAQKKIKEDFFKTKSIYFKLADINEGIPFKKNFFDAVCAVAFLEHIFNPDFIIKESKRVLKNNGILIIEVPNIAWLPYRLDFLLGRLPTTGNEIGWDGGHLHYFTFETVRQLLEQNGFKIVKESTSGIFMKARLVYPSLLGANIIIKAKKQ